MDFIELMETKGILEELAEAEKIKDITQRMDQAFMNYCITHPHFNTFHAFKYAIQQGIDYLQQQLMFKEEALNDDYWQKRR